jgi:hypothetical protein
LVISDSSQYFESFTGAKKAGGSVGGLVGGSGFGNQGRRNPGLGKWWIKLFTEGTAHRHSSKTITLNVVILSGFSFYEKQFKPLRLTRYCKMP